MGTSVVEPSSVVRFERRLWSVETRVGGVYQLRDGLGNLRLAQRHEFTKVDGATNGNGMSLTDKPSNDINRRGSPVRVIPVSRDAAPGRHTYTRAVDVGPDSIPHAAHVTDDFAAGIDAAD